MSTIQHKVEVMSVKTANKDNQKYLGKDGEQAYRVSLKIGEDWYSNMIWDEQFVPKKGQTINIELDDTGEWKNWDYKLKSKKEQMTEQLTDAKEVFTIDDKEIPEVKYEPKSTDDLQERIIRGMAFNGACRTFQVAMWDETYAGEIKKRTLDLYKEMSPWLRGEQQ